VGYERVQEIDDPELAGKRARALYKAKSYPDDWIEKRMHSIATRESLTHEWQERGVKEGKEYAILTAEISEATFGMKPSEYKEHKGLERENLRDHMTNLELIFSMLGEESTIQEAKEEDVQGFPANKKAARAGGNSAKDARVAFEKTSGKKVITDSNFLKKIESTES